jgi:hypothetical protein
VTSDFYPNLHDALVKITDIEKTEAVYKKYGLIFKPTKLQFYNYVSENKKMLDNFHTIDKLNLKSDVLEILFTLGEYIDNLNFNDEILPYFILKNKIKTKLGFFDKIGVKKIIKSDKVYKYITEFLNNNSSRDVIKLFNVKNSNYTLARHKGAEIFLKSQEGKQFVDFSALYTDLKIFSYDQIENYISVLENESKSKCQRKISYLIQKIETKDSK